MTDPLIALFENVPTFEDEVVRGLGKEFSEALNYTGSGQDPIEWMRNSGIPYVYDRPMKKDRPGYICYGIFMNGRTLADCYIQTNPDHNDLSKPDVVRVLWHEIGHAIDHLIPFSEDSGFPAVAGGGLIVSRFHYSTAHAALLKEHAALIVGLRTHGDWSYGDGDWSAYANRPEELWAEAVAIAVCRPAALMPTKLWPVLAEILPSRGITLPAPAAPVAVEAMESRCNASRAASTDTEAEGAGNPLPS